jgi:DNA helicase-2/ATP-dependent DNA helicase PcrA
MEEFQQAYDSLNAAQRRAVDTIEGPVLVVAGPGTGKTQLLGVRAANILQKTDTTASNILCLTFTNKAAANMRERLLRLIGPTAHNVMVRTFHSFAAELMSIYPEYFWNGARLSAAPDAVQLEIVRDILAELPLDNPLALKFAGAFTQLNDVQQVLKLSKEAGLTPQKLDAMVEVNLAYLDIIEPKLADLLAPALSHKKLRTLLAAVESLPDQPIEQNVAPLTSLSTVLKDSLRTAVEQDETTGKTAWTGKWKQRWLQSVDGKKQLFNERQRNAWWRAVADVYGTYRDRLHARGYYDYADMIIEVITQLEQKPAMRADVQERFQYVLIDEFQDTNAAQLRLAHLVADHHTHAGNPNLMAVGDDDQSIFTFNGAELSNMLSFRRMYPGTHIIVLEENYRSSQAVLDTAKLIIEQAEDRLVTREPDISKNLKAVNEPERSGTIEHTAYPTREHQLSAVAKRIAAGWQAEDCSVAVLARSHDTLKRIASLLLKLNVPVRYEQQSNVLDHEAVRQVNLIAGIAIAIGEGHRRTVNHNISELVRHPMWQLSPRALWRLATANFAHPDWLGSLLDSDNKQLAALGNWLIWLSREAPRAPLPLMLEYILGSREGQYLHSPVRDYYAGLREVSNDYLETLSALELLTHLSNEFAARGSARLVDFVRFLDLNRDLGRIVSDETWFMSDEKAVQLLTVHKAKGLEFDTVYVVDATEDIWKPRSGGRKPPANLPLQPYGDSYDDYVRLMYVAATRAKRSLLVSSYYTDATGKELLAAPFVRIALPAATVTGSEADDPITVLETALLWPRLETKNEKALLKDRLQDYSLSVSALLEFLNTATGGPQAFFEKHLLRLPAAQSARMGYGNAIHAAMETAQRLTNSGQFNLETVLDRYEAALGEQYLPPPEYERYLPHGEDVLHELFLAKGYTLPQNAYAEWELSGLELGPARIGGIIDRLHVSGNTLTITDYKTGKPLTSFETRDRTKAIKAWKHTTQLAFYSLLAARSRRFGRYSDVRGEMVYVEAENAKDLIRPYTAASDELERLTKIVAAVWQHINELNFPDTSAYSKDMHGIDSFIEDLLNERI